MENLLNKIKYIYIRERYSLKQKLQLLEDKGVVFRAAYMGYEEVFTAVYPDGTFIDYHWAESNDSKDCQFFTPTQLERVVNETIEYGVKHGWRDELAEFEQSLSQS